MRKQSKAQIVGREGERWFSSALPPEWSIQRPLDDFGIDGIVAIGTSNSLTGREFGVQVKSSTQFRRTTDCIVVPRIPKETVVYWASKFLPTLLVAYDARTKIGYFDWVSNLVDEKDLDRDATHYYLHIPTRRPVSSDAWATIEGELQGFHEEFSKALQATREVIPVATELSIYLRNLCEANLADRADRDQYVLYMTTCAWTHIQIIHRMDQIIPNTRPNSLAARKLTAFRNAYYSRCDGIFHEFGKLFGPNRPPDWIFMKKDADDTQRELIAMLADFVSGLLRFVSPIE